MFYFNLIKNEEEKLRFKQSKSGKREVLIWSVALIAVLVFFSLALYYVAFVSEFSSNFVTVPVSLQLKWMHQAQFAGHYVGIEKGFYRENGLEIKQLIPFSFDDKFPINKVQYRDVDFAITGADELLIAKSNGLADDVVAIAVIYKKNPVTLYTFSDSGINEPLDLIGKTVGIERAGDGTEVNIGILYYAMLDFLRIDRELVSDVTIGYDATELLAGDVDVASGYIINEPYFLIQAGYAPVTISPADYGVNMYADVVIANKNFIKENPKLVASFVDATIKGWKYAIDESNEDEVLDIVLKYAKGSSRAHQQYMLDQSRPLISPIRGENIGKMSYTEWSRSFDILLNAGLIGHHVVVSEVFTNDFT